MTTATYIPGRNELLEAGTIRARMIARRYGIASPKTLEVVVRFGKMIDEAQAAKTDYKYGAHND